MHDHTINIILYRKDTQDYRTKIFSNYTISEIFDFTHLRRNLFHKTADTPVIALIAIDKPSNRESINHTVVKRLTSSENKIKFEIDHYDRHIVRWDWAVDSSKQFIWKTNLLGGGRLFHLIYRFSIMPKLKLFVDDSGWQQDRGFEGGKRVVKKNIDRIIALKNGEPEILNTILYTNKLKSSSLYKPPFILIDQVIGEKSLSACFIPINNKLINKKLLYYSRDFVGISGPEKDESALKGVYDQLISTKEDHLNYQLYVLAKSSTSMVLTETDINKSEILEIPYSGDSSILKLSKSEEILQHDVLKFYRHLGKAITRKSSGFILNKKVTSEQVKEYGMTLCETLNEIYSKNNKSWQLGKIYQTSIFTIYQIGFGKNNGLPQLLLQKEDETIIELLKDNNFNRAAIYKRILRIYKHQNSYDCIFLIKPHAFRYWLRSISLRDADETFIDLKKEGF